MVTARRPGELAVESVRWRQKPGLESAGATAMVKSSISNYYMYKQYPASIQLVMIRVSLRCVLCCGVFHGRGERGS